MIVCVHRLTVVGMNGFLWCKSMEFLCFVFLSFFIFLSYSVSSLFQDLSFFDGGRGSGGQMRKMDRG